MTTFFCFIIFRCFKDFSIRWRWPSFPRGAAMVIYEAFLGHRHDYTGHFAAGYGATLAAAMFALPLLPVRDFTRVATTGLIPFCLFCIGLGTITEATIFRLARFDEIDFCNQSLGATLAGVCLVPWTNGDKLAEKWFNYGLIVGIVFLGAGGVYAVA